MLGFSSGGATAVMLLVTLMWGSWFQVVKHTGTYPIVAFISWLYTFAVGIVWAAVALLGGRMVPGGVGAEVSANPGKAALVLLCGAVFAVAMQLHLTVVGRIGLILSTSVSATCAILSGAIISALLGGLPEGVSFFQIITAALLLVLATITCQVAGARREGAGDAEANLPQTARKSDIAMLVFINTLLMSAYPLANSLALRSEQRPVGLSPLTLMGILSLGALAGSWAFTLLRLGAKKQLASIKHPGIGMPKLLGLACIAAVCHFGGNVLQAMVAPVLSVAIATTLGNAYHVWSYVWGLVYGEFRGSSRRTYATLCAGILLFVAGVVLLSLA